MTARNSAGKSQIEATLLDFHRVRKAIIDVVAAAQGPEPDYSAAKEIAFEAFAILEEIETDIKEGLGHFDLVADQSEAPAS